MSNTANTSSAMPPGSETKCGVCGQSSTSYCKKCKLAWYCSPGCQRYDWKLHKHLCSESPYPPKDPLQRSVRAIYFPEDGSGPSFLELALISNYDEDDGVHWDSVEKAPIYPKDWWVQEVRIGRNLVSNQNLGYTLMVGVKEDGLVDPRCSTNLCLRKLNTTGCPILHPWPGPLRAVKIATMPRFSTTETYLDIEITDLRHVMDYFVLYLREGAELKAAIAKLRQDIPAFSKPAAGNTAGGGGTSIQTASQSAKKKKGKEQKKEQAILSAASTNRGNKGNQSSMDLPLGSTTGGPDPSTVSSSTGTTSRNPSLGTPIKGVRIYCRGDQTELKVAKFMPVTLTAEEVEQMSLSTRPIAPITALIDLPIRVYKPQIPVSKLKYMDWSPENQSATFLHLDPKSGWAPLLEWQNDVGTVLLVRDDGKELYVEHAEALCEFCQHHLGLLFGNWKENGGSEVTLGKQTRQVDYEMTRDGFKAWFERYRIQQAMQVLGMDETRRYQLGLDFKWERWISPYDVQT